MVRNPKAYKVKRGGGRAFSRDLSRLDADGNAPGEADSSSEEESSSEESEEDNRQIRVGQLPPIVDSESEEDDADMTGLSRNLNSTLSTAPRPLAPDAPTLSNSRLGEMTAEKVAAARKERKAAAANKGGKAPVKQSVQKGSDESSEASEAEENENHRRVGNMKPSALAAPRELSRREKEAAAKEAAKERYAKLHAAGKTDEAKADLGRLAEVRRNRELAAAKRIAETAAKDEAAAKAFEKSGKKGPLKR